MSTARHTFRFRVRYGDTDQMGSYFNSRALDWFEVGRTELSRAMGLPYTEWEARGVYMPVVEAHLKFKARAVYDDLLEQTVTLQMQGRVRLRFENRIVRVSDGVLVCEGYTVHALIDKQGKLVKTPDWVFALLDAGGTAD